MSQFVTRGPLIQMLIRWGTTQNLFLAYTDNLKNIFIKKSHTCEEGGAQFRNFVWHLLMNFEKTRKIRILKNNFKKMLEISSFYSCVPKTTIILGTVSEIPSETKKFLSCWAIFCFLPLSLPLHLLTTQETKILKK